MKSIIGVDVAKDQLMIYLEGQHYHIENSVSGLNQWIKQHALLAKQADLWVYEPTGGYEKTLAHWLQAQQLPACRVHANHVRHYAKAMGKLAKTDKIDAQWIAEYARAKGCVPSAHVVAQHPRLCALVARREQLLSMKAKEQSRLETLDDEWVRQDIQQHMTSLRSRIREVDNAIKLYIKSRPTLSQHVSLISSIPGVGNITAYCLLAYLPELNTERPKPLAALCGLAPISCDSGRKQGKRRIYGGRAQIRRVLYMAAFVARQRNPELKAFYERLIAKGKPYKVATTAVMRKLVTLIHRVVNRGTPWLPTVTPETD